MVRLKHLDDMPDGVWAAATRDDDGVLVIALNDDATPEEQRRAIRLVLRAARQQAA